MLSKLQAFDSLVLEVFRLHGSLLAAGDALVADIGLTSARWQVLGAVAKAAEPPSISDVARSTGVSRQAARRVVDDLIKRGLLREVDRSTRARRLLLTESGLAAHDDANVRQRPWAIMASRDFDATDLRASLDIIRNLRASIEESTLAIGEV